MQQTHEYQCIVVGGGASGLMCAGVLARAGVRTLVLEKNARLGVKLSISGGGRCNITNAEDDVRVFLQHFPQAHNFLYSPFSQFSVADTFSFFESRGLPLVVEARKRAFPESQNANDVVTTLTRELDVPHVAVRTGVSVQSLWIEDDVVRGVILADGSRISSTYTVLATGGVAAPETGSTGDGFRMLKDAGHTVHKPNPNVVPLKTDAQWVHRLSGTTHDHAEIRFSQGGKTRIKKRGKILFTHFGISGPLILNSSYEVSSLLKHAPVHTHINLFPDLNEAQLDAKLVKLFDAHKNKKLRNVLPELLHKNIAHAVIFLAGEKLGEVSVHSITRDERKGIVKTMQALGFPITGTMGFNRAVIVDGGVDLPEVDFKHMHSRRYEQLYILGDLLHINRPSGGFSLQLCWTTGWVAAQSIIRTLYPERAENTLHKSAQKGKDRQQEVEE